MSDEIIITEQAATPRKARIGFHPKKWLKSLQQGLYTSPYLYLLFCFLVPVVLNYIMYLSKGLYPFFDGSPLVLDLNSQYVYFFEALREFVYGNGSLLYSFSRSLGGEFMGIYAYYMASPLTYIVALFPADRIQEAVLCLLLLKSGLCGLSFGFYLHKRSRNPKKLIIFTFSVMYALSAYAVVQQNNTMWIDALILLPLFAYGLEKLISERKFKLYTVTLALILISNYYIGYMVCIFAVLYFLFCYFSKSEAERNPRGEKLHFWRTGGRFAAFSVLAAAIAAFMLIVAYYSLGFGKSDFSNPNWSLTGNFDIIDFLTKFLPGAYDTVEPAGMPFVYCGLLMLFMLPVYFVSKSISAREKIASGAMLAVFFLSFFLNPLDLIWHGFSVPNWLNGRYSFLFCFFVLVLAYKGFGNMRRVGEKFLLGIAAIIIFFVAVAEKFELEAYINSKDKLLTLGCIWFSIFFAVVLLVLLCLRIRTFGNEKTRRSVSAVLAAVICVELLCNGIVCFVQLNADVSFTRYSSYQNHLANLRPVVEQIEELDGGFYRAEKNHHRTKNDNMALGLRGITNSTSTLNATAIRFANLMGYTGRAHLTMYRGGTPFSDSLLGIKYVIDNNTIKSYDSHYTYLENIESETYRAYQNPYALSIAYGVDDGVAEFDMEQDDTFFERYNSLAKAMMGKSEDVPMFVPVSGMQSKVTDCTESNKISSVKYQTEEKKGGKVTFTYTAPYTGSYYFYSPVSYAYELRLKVNNSTSVSYQGKDTNHVVRIGDHEAGSTIEITLEIPKDTGVTFYTLESFLWYLDADVYTETMQALQAKPQFAIAADSTDDHLSGSITTTAEDKMILTTIPFDKGWNVFVDGERVETYEALGALMAFDIENAGEHTLTLEYMPSCYKLGAVISIFGMLCFALLCGAEFVLKRTLLKSCALLSPAPADTEFWVLEDLDTEPEESPMISDEANNEPECDESDEKDTVQSSGEDTN